MMRLFSFALLLTVLVALAGCGGSRYHGTAMPDPGSYRGHFGDMDRNGDEAVEWEEFRAYFPHAEPHVFQTIDMNHDNALDHDEWHAFKEAHGLKEHD